MESSLRSLEGSTATAIQFINASAEVRQIYWLDYAGQRHLYASLAPWQAYVQPTYVTQPWLVTSSSGPCLGIYLPTGRQAMAVLRSGTSSG